jgi:cell wall-associated NlpC family hydrolase
MRRGVWFLVLGVVLAALGAASALAAGTTTTPTTTTTSTTTGTTPGTTTTTTQSYAALRVSSLPSRCVGAGAAVLARPSGPPVALGTPASYLGPSGYLASGAVVAFGSSIAGGSGCHGATVELASVVLFGGVVTADSVTARDGWGAVAGLQVDGSPVSVTAGQTIPVESWGQLTVGATFGRLRAPLVLRLTQAHGPLPAGTRIGLAFAAAPTVAESKTTGHLAPNGQGGHKTAASSAKTSRKATESQSPPPDFPVSPYPFAVGGVLGPAARLAQHNPVVSTAMHYLGIRYQWGGETPSTGFDCSGLVTYVFAQLGVALPHYTVSQWDSPDAVPVQANHLKPGDLVFFVGSDGTRTAPGHVGIYVGNGYLIDAPHTGSFVRIDRLTDPRLAGGYVGARRIDSRLADTHQLVDARKPAPTPFRLGFASIGPLGESLGVAASSTVALEHSSDAQVVSLGGALLGGLCLLFSGGAFLFRRRREPETAPNGEPSD